MVILIGGNEIHLLKHFFGLFYIEQINNYNYNHNSNEYGLFHSIYKS